MGKKKHRRYHGHSGVYNNTQVGSVAGTIRNASLAFMNRPVTRAPVGSVTGTIRAAGGLIAARGRHFR
jgi:hypothetical protein